jgi:monoamine oxidase
MAGEEIPDQFSEAVGNRRGKQVAILGAGVAGLAAEYELERLGHRVEVFEAAPRIGGRIRTHRFGPGPRAPFAELGAMRIPTHHHHAMRYVARLGLAGQQREFKTLLSDENAYLGTGTGYVRIRDAAKELVDNCFGASLRERYRHDTLLFAAWLTTVVDAIAPPDLRGSLRGDLNSHLLDLLERAGVSGYLSGRGRADLHAFFDDHPEVGSACSGALGSFLDDILVETSTQLVELRGGMGQIVERLAAAIRGPVRRRHEIVGLHVRKDDVLIAVRHAGRIRMVRSDYALCTIPFSVLRRIRLEGIDDDKAAAIRETVYCPATKVAFHCSEPFWEREGITGGASFSAGVLRQTYYPAAEGDAESGATLLASYTIGDDADRLGRMTDSARHEFVKRELGRMHPQLLRRGMVLGAVSAAWGQHEWSAGGCAVRWGGDASECEEERWHAARPQNRLFFAGEHCSSTPAWIDGAIESAITAVRDIARHEPVSRAMAAVVA